MCIISDKLKLCSCKTENVELLKHYWILKRFTKKTEWLVGEMMLPANIGETADRLNQTTIQNQLNSGNCFDVELNHQENDILELHFTYKVDPEIHFNLICNGDFLAYSFKFKKEKWRKGEYNTFAANLIEVQKGNIRNPF